MQWTYGPTLLTTWPYIITFLETFKCDGVTPWSAILSNVTSSHPAHPRWPCWSHRPSRYTLMYPCTPRCAWVTRTRAWQWQSETLMWGKVHSIRLSKIPIYTIKWPKGIWLFCHKIAPNFWDPRAWTDSSVIFIKPSTLCHSYPHPKQKGY